MYYLEKIDKILWIIVSFPRHLGYDFATLKTAVTSLWLVTILVFFVAVIRFLRESPPRPFFIWMFILVLTTNIVLDFLDVLDQGIWGPRFIVIGAFMTIFSFIEIALEKLEKSYYVVACSTILVTITSCFMFYTVWAGYK